MTMTSNNHDEDSAHKGEIKGIQESLLTILDTKFQNFPNSLTEQINLQNNAITLKDWLTKAATASTIEEVEAFIPTKENG